MQDKKYPLVSVCVTAYNAEKHIAETLDSLLIQTYKSIEIIVVDDGSTDDTPKILNTYKKYGIKVVTQSNKGQCAAANKAYSESNGDYIKFFDADDLLSQDFIKEQVESLAGETDCVASATWGRFYNNDISTFKLVNQRFAKKMKPIDWLVESLWNGPNMMQCGLWLIPRNVLAKSGLWNETLSLINDFDFFIRVLVSAHKIIFCDNAVLYYRSGESGTLSAQKSRKAYESAYNSTELGIKALLSYENTERTRRVSSIAFQEWGYHFYPLHKDLYFKSEAWIKTLGRAPYSYPAGGITKVLVKVLGWKLTKTIKQLLKK